MGCKGKGEFNIFSGGILTGGMKVVDELVKLLKAKVSLS